MARPGKTDPIAAAAGAGSGALLGGPLGAALGGMLGGAAGTDKLPLEAALRLLLATRNLSFVSLRRETRRKALLTYAGSDSRYWTLPLDVSGTLTQEAELEQLDDALYDAAVVSLPNGTPR